MKGSALYERFLVFQFDQFCLNHFFYLFFIGGCDFENGLCTWTNAQSGDDFDWMVGKGATGSSFTGPSNDHTLNNQVGHYLFIEASRPELPGQKANFISQSFAATSSRCLTFW